MNCIILATDTLMKEDEKHIEYIVREFQKRDHALVYLSKTPPADHGENYKKMFFNPRFTSSLSLVWIIFSPLLFIINIIRIIRLRIRYAPHALICATCSDVILFAPCARMLGIPTYILFPKPIPRLLKWLYALYAKNTHSIFPFPSLQQLTGIRQKNISIIPPCIHIKQQPLPLDSVPTHQQQRFILGTASPLNQRSGVEYIIKAIPLIQEMIPDMQLVIVGSGPEKQRILWLVAQLGLREYIKLVGSEDHRENWMKHFTVFAFCPDDSFASMEPAIEAMAAQRVVIASDIPPLRDIITPSKHGILIPPHNSEMIAQAVINLFNHPDWRETMGGLARKHAQEHFSIETVMQKYENLLV